MANEMKSVVMEVKYSDFKALNPDFTRCRCNVFYTGRNRNRSDITPNALSKLIARKGYANIPVIGHRRSDSENVMGGHDRKIEVENGEINIINQCVPYGVIPEDCNPAMDKIIDIHGQEKEYFSVDVILWTSYYPEIMEMAGDPNVLFNQSMEVIFNKSYIDEDGYVVVDDFSLQALCMLGRYNDERKNQSTEPAFEDSTIHRFSIDESQFKQNFELMLKKLKTYKTGNNPVQDNSKIVTKEEKALNYENIKNAITSEMIPDSDVSRYAVLNCDDTSIVVFDRVDYSCCTIRYAVEKSEDTEKIIFDFNNRIDMAFSVVEKNADCYDFKSEFSAIVDRASKDSAVYAVEKARAEFDLEKIAAVKEITDKYEVLQQEFNYLKSEKDRADAKLAEYATAEQMAKAEAHKNEIDAVIDRYADKLGTNPDYLIYKTTVDYSKEAKDVDLDMLVLLGKASMGAKSTFSYQPQRAVWGANFSVINEVSDTTGRYGDLFDKVKNK